MRAGMGRTAMSEEYDADETVEGNKNSASAFSRRQVVKAIGASSAIATMPGIAAAKSSESDQNIELVDSRVKDKQEATKDVDPVQQSHTADEVSNSVAESTGFKLTYDTFVSVEIETSDDELNSYSPAIVYLPFEPNTTPTTADNGGALMALTIEEDGKRQPAAVLGITRETNPIRSQSVSYSSQDEVTVKAFGDDGNGIGKVSETSDSPVSDDSAAEYSTQVQVPDISCGACIAVIGTACAGSAALSVSSCASAAVATGAFNAFAGGAVAAFCTYVVANAGGVTCAAAPFSICAAAQQCSVTG